MRHLCNILCWVVENVLEQMTDCSSKYFVTENHIDRHVAAGPYGFL